MSTPKDHIVAPNIAKAIVALKTITFCREQGWFTVVFEGDALQVVNALKSSTSNWSSYSHLIEEAQS